MSVKNFLGLKKEDYKNPWSALVNSNTYFVFKISKLLRETEEPGSIFHVAALHLSLLRRPQKKKALSAL